MDVIAPSSRAKQSILYHKSTHMRLLRRFAPPGLATTIPTPLSRYRRILSLAHCWSSVSTLPSSVQAKPHCGDRQSWSSGAYFAASSRRRLMSSFFSSVAGLGGDEADHHALLALGQEAQRLEPAGALGVVLQEIAVVVDAGEQHLGHRLVAALRDPGRAEVAAADMGGDRHVGRLARRRVDDAGVDLRQVVGVVAALARLLQFAPSSRDRPTPCRRAAGSGSRRRRTP